MGIGDWGLGNGIDLNTVRLTCVSLEDPPNPLKKLRCIHKSYFPWDLGITPLNPPLSRGEIRNPIPSP